MTTEGRSIDQARRALRLCQRLARWAAASVQASRSGQELSLRQLGALFAIREGLTSPGQMARRLRVTPAVVTGLVDRLVRQGHVRREADPDDRRKLKLALTETGTAVSQSVERSLTEPLAGELAAAEAAEIEAMGRALDLLERALTALEARTPKVTDGGLDGDNDVWGENTEEP
ncbi:MarR family transcriptional regulator [Polyangium sp. 6x1]|uniref:MarR family transcriptional regulator n=1 Tax=Polyangium sp. 6x1 TaxID=3042689 RepID=UPI0024822F4E|nr:MarR family transcriptional regulator [Polyangium sp. 6x1]MDI1447481.1 MarR family transcriptional regulator [Polyangium sp. 6x1]